MSLNTILATAPLTTQNYHLKMIGTSIGNSLIWDNGTNVGIGTASPNGSYRATISGPASGVLGGLAIVDTEGASYSIYSASNNLTIRDVTNAATRVTLTSAGNVGIGTSSPTAKLDVNGEIRMTGSTLFRGMSSNTLQLCGGTSSSNVKIDGSVEIVTIDTNGSERMRITSGGNVLIGKSSTGVDDGDGFRFDSSGVLFTSVASGENTYYLRDITNAVYRFYVTAAGTINATSTTISAISDARLKENITDLQIGLDAIMALRPRQFDWKKESGNDGKNVRGFIAQEFEEVFPDLIDESINKTPQGEPYKQIRQDLIPILVKAIQEQQAIITSLQDRLDKAGL